MAIYAFKSDAHMLDGGPTDNHKGVAHRCLKMLNWLAEKAVAIFDLGDKKCWRQARRNDDKQKALEDIDVFNADELELEKELGVKGTEGNHDKGNGEPRRYDFGVVGEAGAFRIIAEHGHRFDIWCSKLGFVGIAATYISGWLERRGWWNAEEILSKLAKRIPGREQKESVYWKGMKKEIDRLVKKGETRKIVYVIGHTHRKLMTEYNGHLLVQDGRCSTRLVQCFLFDTDTGKGIFKSF